VRTAAAWMVGLYLVLFATSGLLFAQNAELEWWPVKANAQAAAPPDNEAFRALVQQKFRINLKLVFAENAADLDAKISSAAAANRLPDLFTVNRAAWFKLIRAGMIAPLDSLWTKIPARVRKYYVGQDLVHLVSYHGKTWALPDPGSKPAAVVEGLVIRKDWLDRLKLKMPETTEELFAVAKAFTRRDPDGNGKNDTWGFGAFIDKTGSGDLGLGRRFIPLLGAYGVAETWDLSNARSFSLNVRKPGYYAAICYLRSLVVEKVMNPDWANLNQEGFRQAWKQGKFGIMFEHFAALHQRANYTAFDQSFPDGEWVGVPAIKGPEGLVCNSVALADNVLTVVSARAAADPKKIDAIAKLYEYLSTPEAYYLLGFGQKDQNYRLSPGGRLSLEGLDPLHTVSSEALTPVTQLRQYVYTNSRDELDARYPSYKTRKGRLVDPLGTLRFFNRQPYAQHNALAFITPPTNAADLERYMDENLVRFCLGQTVLNAASWEGFLQGLDRLGARAWEKDVQSTLVSEGWLP